MRTNNKVYSIEEMVNLDIPKLRHDPLKYQQLPYFSFYASKVRPMSTTPTKADSQDTFRFKTTDSTQTSSRKPYKKPSNSLTRVNKARKKRFDLAKLKHNEFVKEKECECSCMRETSSFRTSRYPNSKLSSEIERNYQFSKLETQDSKQVNQGKFSRQSSSRRTSRRANGYQARKPCNLLYKKASIKNASEREKQVEVLSKTFLKIESARKLSQNIKQEFNSIREIRNSRRTRRFENQASKSSDNFAKPKNLPKKQMVKQSYLSSADSINSIAGPTTAIYKHQDPPSPGNSLMYPISHYGYNF